MAHVDFITTTSHDLECTSINSIGVLSLYALLVAGKAYSRVVYRSVSTVSLLPEHGSMWRSDPGADGLGASMLRCKKMVLTGFIS